MATYKTKDGTLTGFVPGVGQIVDGKITVPDGVVIENANLVKIDETSPQPAAPTAPAAPVASQPVNTAPAPQAQTNQENL